MVSKDESLVLTDFCGSSLNSSTVVTAPLVRYRRPIPIEERSLNIFIRDDLFALSIMLYEIEVSSRI
jgi:hypothetical protein